MTFVYTEYCNVIRELRAWHAHNKALAFRPSMSELGKILSYLVSACRSLLKLQSFLKRPHRKLSMSRDAKNEED